MKKYLLVFLASVSLAACNQSSPNNDTSTPIDSTNVNGTAPVRSEAMNPAADTLSTRNDGDTGTKANNVHNTNER
jgi:hypothetical protein